MSQRSPITTSVVLSALALTAIVAYGAWLRLEDPLQTRSLGAEDPFTHVVFIDEWAEQGYFADSYNLGTTMYPPGMHVVMAVLVAVSGFDTVFLARVVPPLVGALSILGMYALATRLGGRAAGLSTALLTAVLPEHIFRSNMLFPTTFDLALMPLMLLAWHMVAQPANRGDGAIPEGRMAPAFFFILTGVAIALMHPWAVVLFIPPMALYAALRALRAGGRPGDVARRLAFPSMLLIPVAAFAITFRWDQSDTGFSDFLGALPGLEWVADTDPNRVMLFVLLSAGFLAAALASLAAVSPLALLRARNPRVRFALSAAFAGALLAAFWLWVGTHTPEVRHVDLVGFVAIAGALVGVALAFLRPTPLGDMGFFICLVLFPLTAINVFSSPFWPERTVVYLSIGMLLLCGTVPGFVYRLLVGFVGAKARARSVVVPTALVVSLLLTAGAVTARPAATYDWYRLYPEDSYAGFEDVVEILEADQPARVFAYPWQPALMVKAIGHPDFVWYSPAIYRDEAARANLPAQVDGTSYVLVDAYTEAACAKGKCDLSFLEDASKYPLVYQSYDGEVRLYRVVL